MSKRVAFIFVIVLILSLGLQGIGFAQPAADPPPPETPSIDPEIGAIQNEDGIWFMPAGRLPELHGLDLSSPSPVGATSSPDNFGYYWDDSETYSWTDTSGGTDTGMTGSDNGMGPVPLPFSFKYYENTYTQVYISANGYLTFTNPSYWASQSPIPSSNTPNDVIAPLWVPAHIPAGAWVHYQTGGIAPNREFIVEWHDISSGTAPDDADDIYRFQVVLHEDGDIVFYYQTIDANLPYTCASAGIEDSTGNDGLTYAILCSFPQSSAVRFYRPAPSARLRLTPENQGNFYSPGDEKSYPFTITNTGELGADTYDITSTANWSLSLFESDGTTPLTDTDSDAIIDTGSIAQGGSRSFVAKVTAPGSARVGDQAEVSVTATSSLNASASSTTYLQGAIPARFAQALLDGDDGVLKLKLNKSASQVEKSVSGPYLYGSHLAVINSPDGNFVYAWSSSRNLPSTTIWVSEIYYTILDRNGDTILPLTKLADHSSAVDGISDQTPSLAVTPSGQIGIAWTRVLNNDATSEFNQNVYLMIMDDAGSATFGPENLTNNSVWGQWSTENNPVYSSIHITATPDSRFTIAWDKDTTNGMGTFYEEVEYAIRSNTGASVQSSTQISASGYFSNLAPLTGNHNLLTYSTGGEIYYVVLNSSGSIVKSATNLVGDGTSIWDSQSDAALLSDGKILVAWTGGSDMRFAVLDTSYNRIVSPVTLTNMATSGSDDYVSVAPTVNGQAVLTWMTWSMSNRDHLYYALVNSSGTVITNPIIYKTAQNPGYPSIIASTSCQGNTAYALTPDVSFDHWAFNWIEALYNSGITSGYPDGTYRPENPVTRAEMAVFLLNGMGVSAPAIDGSHPFSDIAGHWAEAYIEELYDQGITGGYPDGTLLKGIGVIPPALDGSHPFTDVAGHWAEIFIEELYDQGITGGYPDGTYRPENRVTRAEMAVFLVNTFNIPLP